MDFNSYVFSKATASRIYGKEAKAVEVERDRVITTFSDGTSETTSTVTFKEHFAEHRREQGKDLSPMPGKNNLWHVGKFRVTVHPNRLSCNCRDWQSQSAIGIKRPCCKHCFSVLYQLGYGKLSEYLEAKGSVTATNQKSDSQSQLSSSLADCASCKYAQKIPSLFTEKQRYFCTLAYVESTNAQECLGDRAPNLINKATI